MVPRRGGSQVKAPELLSNETGPTTPGLPPHTESSITWLRPMRIISQVLVLILCDSILCLRCTAAELLDDKTITIQSEPDVEKSRGKLIGYLWGVEGLPLSRFPDHVVTNVATPVHHLEHLKRVDDLRMDLAPGLEGLAYHFIPEQPNGSLVILHHGHACTMDDDPSPQELGNGMQRTIQALLGAGYGVAGIFMPHMRPGDCTGKHEQMFALKTTGSPIKFFLEPTAITINYLGDAKKAQANQFPRYNVFHMIGLSGGGWTTTVYAALDPRIRCSFSVAGTMPLYLRSGGSIGDREQFEPSFYRLGGYPDLYILGAQGPGRSQIQIVLRHDDCCFGASAKRSTIQKHMAWITRQPSIRTETRCELLSDASSKEIFALKLMKSPQAT